MNPKTLELARAYEAADVASGAAEREAHRIVGEARARWLEAREELARHLADVLGVDDDLSAGAEESMGLLVGDRVYQLSWCDKDDPEENSLPYVPTSTRIMNPPTE